EYPVYGYGRSEPLGFMVSVIPRITENRWFPAKSWSGNVFVPNHEVGNILSYGRDIPDNPDVLEEIKGTSFNTYSLGSRTGYKWTLEFADFEEVGAAVDLSYGFKVGQLIQIGTAGELSVEGDVKPLGVGVSVGASTEFAFGFGTEVTSSFDAGLTATHTTSVQTNLKLGVALGSVADDEKAYVVKPYAYWSDYGALVVDYACWPELASPGYTTNWWQDTYGWASDPAFALPWRHDRAKGLELLDDVKTSLTRDIQFAPKNPRPGERVLIVARVRNYALLPTPGPVSVHFFRGNPADGGTPLVSDRGFLSAEVGPIPERGEATARFVWVVPPDILPFERIYAVLDRDDRYEEIQDANNMAWNVLGTNDPAADLAGARLRGGVELLGTYPNPFRPPTTIRYALARRGEAHVRIFDVTGALVRTLGGGPHARGTHRVQWDGRSDGGGLVGSGIYFYEVRSGGSAESGKIVMVR
ncbi:MAG: FlgD immunoglobulin-like domain containing protein, partial [bacterium]